MGLRKQEIKGKARETVADVQEAQEIGLSTHHPSSTPQSSGTALEDCEIENRTIDDNAGESSISPIEEQGTNDLAIDQPSTSSPASYSPLHQQSQNVISGGFFTRAQDISINGGSFEQTHGHRQNVTIHLNVRTTQDSREEEYVHAQQHLPSPPASTVSPLSNTSEHNTLYKQDQPAFQVQSNQHSIPSVSITEYSPDNSNVIYERHLTLKRRGFPLWIPGPNMMLPMPYRRKGVDVGDVGIITTSGGFSFLFNICLPANNPINPPILPEGFSPIYPQIGPLDLRKYQEFGPGSYLSSAHIERIHNEPPSIGLSFKTSAAEGAILTLPEGAIALDLENLSRFEAYAATNIASWYRYANGPRGRQAKNGEIRLVIGCDKATSWGMAAIANLTQHMTHHLKYRPMEDSDNRTTSVSSIPEYRWECSGMAEARVGPDLREIEELKRNDDSDLAIDGKYWNQSLFLRTLNLTLSDEVFAVITQELQSALTQESKQFQNKGQSSNSTTIPPSSNSLSNYATQESGTITGNQRGSGTELSGPSTSSLKYAESLMPTGKEHVTMSISPSAPKLHPADFLNKLLLQKAKTPNIRVVITQDKHWYSVIKDEDEIMPNPAELAERVLAAHFIREVDGIVYLEPRLLANRAMSTAQHSNLTETWTKPSWSGWIETTGDALLILEAAKRGLIPRFTRRLVSSERKMITSGSVFVFDEDDSGTKRWTDGVFWSPSCILGNFLLYRETDRRGAGQRSAHTNQALNETAPVAASFTTHDARVSPNSRVDNQRERTLIGSLTNGFKFKSDGLMKKTFSVKIRGVTQHIISYYKVKDVEYGGLHPPSRLAEFASLDISPEYLDPAHFRNPPKVEIGVDGTARYCGEADEIETLPSPLTDPLLLGMSLPLVEGWIMNHSLTNKRGKVYEPYGSPPASKRARRNIDTGGGSVLNTASTSARPPEHPDMDTSSSSSSSSSSENTQTLDPVSPQESLSTEVLFSSSDTSRNMAESSASSGIIPITTMDVNTAIQVKDLTRMGKRENRTSRRLGQRR